MLRITWSMVCVSLKTFSRVLLALASVKGFLSFDITFSTTSICPNVSSARACVIVIPIVLIRPSVIKFNFIAFFIIVPIYF